MESSGDVVLITGIHFASIIELINIISNYNIDVNENEN